MTPNRRIFLNIVATYGRSVFALICGLFTARWVLMALGQEDFGLYSVVGGMTVFIGLINMLLGVALNRFYAVSVGAAKTALNEKIGLLECRKWFSTAVLIHTMVPILLMIVGYPIGKYAICHGLVSIPSARLSECVWVFRFSCISCFVSMCSVPYYAMYMAKQYMAELTFYTVGTAAIGMLFFYYMATHPGVWLSKYAAWMAVANVIPTAVIAVRARFLFPECRLLICEMFSASRFLKLATFAGWQAFGGIGNMLRIQGVAILLNRHVEFGSMRNSSMSVANQVAAQTDTLSGSMLGAFQPAIASAYGAKEFDRMRALSFCCCKISTVGSLIFVLPLLLELEEVLSLWLKDPPIYAAGLCSYILFAHVIDRTSVGHMIAVTAVGKIATYQAFLGGALIFALPLAWLFLQLGLGIYWVGTALLLSTTLSAWGRVWFARSIAGMSVRRWLKSILMPVSVISVTVLAVGCAPRFLMPQSFFRVMITTALCEVAIFACAWKVLFDDDEKQYVRARIIRLFHRSDMEVRNDIKD